MQRLFVIKIGGNVIDRSEALDVFLSRFSKIQEPKILIHGGGAIATRIGEKLQIKSNYVNGRRITDAETLDLVTMVYGGLINKQIVAALQARGKNAIGLTGADGDLIRSKKRVHATIDYGFVGDITQVNTDAFEKILGHGQIPVIAPLTHDGNGQILNTNADTMAQSVAVALSRTFQTTLVFGFEKAGVLRDRSDESSVISRMSRSEYKILKENGTVNEGMIPKLDNAFQAIDAGVSRVVIGKADRLSELLNGNSGTTLSNE